jgi:hypothetical protein
MQCADFEEQAILYCAGELPEEARTRVETHARACAMCADVLAAEMELRRMIGERRDGAEEDASGLLLARCRSELAEALDDAEARRSGAGWLSLLQPSRWATAFGRAMAFHPGWSTAALLVAGALGGLSARAWYRQSSMPLPAAPTMTVSAAARVTDEELERMGVESVRWEPQEGLAAPRVEVQLRSQQPTVVQGTADDADVRRVLRYIVEHGQKFDPGVRLDALDVLRTRTADPEIRATLCDAAVHDGNPAVRLKALEALSGYEADPRVREAMLGVLENDDNSGARIEAINSLLGSSPGSSEESGSGEAAISGVAPLDAEAVRVLRDRMENDDNRYVRMRSGNALSELANAESGPSGTSLLGSSSK